ncbi:MAG: carboxymuconolactone decarboxylase family protein [Halococcoides sp.]
MADDTESEELPAAAGAFADEYPEVWEAYTEMGAAAADAGSIDDETKRLVKLAVATGAQSEGAVHSHVRRGLEEGIDPDALRQVAVLAMTTIGFPNGMAALTWIEDLTAEDSGQRE